MRREFAAFLGYGEEVGKDGVAWSTTTNVANNLVVSTELSDYGYDDIVGTGQGDDIFEMFFALLLDDADGGSTGGNVGVIRRVSAYDASLGSLTVTGSALTGEDEAIDFELHKYNPTLLREVINTARRLAFPMLYIPVTRTLFTAQQQVRYEVPSAIIGRPVSIWLERGLDFTFANNIITDGGLEEWTNSTTLANYTATTLDLAQETTTTTPRNYAVFRDSFSARCTSQTGNTGTLAQSLSSFDSYSGQRISMSVWVYCLTADIVSAYIKVDSGINLGTAASGGLHGGSGWEFLTLTVDSTITIATSLDVGISVVSSATDTTEFYVDELICVVGPLQEPELYGQELRRWDWVPINQGTTLRNEVVFPYGFPDMYRLRFEGQGYLSSVSADTDTMEIERPQNDLLYAYAAEELFRRLSRASSDVEDNWFRVRMREVRADKERLLVHAMSGPRRKLQIPNWG